MQRLILKNVIIKEGTNEYRNSEIIQNSNLSSVVNRAVAFKGFASIIDELNQENAIVVITIDSNYTIKNLKFQNISTELHDKFLRFNS